MISATDIAALSVAVVGQRILALVKESCNSLSLLQLNRTLNTERKLATLRASKGFILDVQEDTCLLAVDDNLVALRNDQLEPVLKAHSPANSFWHAARGGDFVYVQEYGWSPTGIWASTRNYENWRLLTTNVELDKSSKHFHNIAYDSFSKQLVTVLGDGNIVRVATLANGEETWRPIYKGPWQFVPIVILRDMLVLGMDSGIVKGGVGIYVPHDDRWNFIFLKWCGKVKFSQMCDLKRLRNGLWVAALGTPQAILVSEDLITWYALHIDGFGEKFNHYMRISEREDCMICSTGKCLLMFDKDGLKNRMRSSKPVMVSYKACVDRLSGLGFTIKNKFLASLDM